MDRLRFNSLVTLSASFYWAFNLIMISGQGDFGAPAVVSIRWLMNITCCLVALVILGVSRLVFTQKTFDLLAITAAFFCFFGLGVFLIRLALNGTFDFWVAASISIPMSLGAGIIMQMQSLHFTMIRMRDSIVVICATTFLSIALFFVVISLPRAAANILYFLMPAISALCSLGIRGHADFEKPSKNSASRLQNGTFWAARLLYGLGIGFLIGLSEAIFFDIELSSAVQNVCGIIGMLILILLSIAFISRTTIVIKPYMLPALPIVAITLIGILTFGSKPIILYQLEIAASWLCFMILSSVQIAYYRNLFGMRASSIAFGEKAVVITSWTFALIIGYFLASRIFNVDTISILSSSFTAIIVIATVIALTRFSMLLNSPGSLSENPAKIRETIVSRCHSLSRLNNLTQREDEILILLAFGKSPDRIADELVISVATVRTHCARIFRKLDVHKYSEVVELVSNYSE